MKIQRRNLIVALLAVLSSLPFGTGVAAIAQDANAVNIRPALPPAGRGLVAADVTVNKNRVRVGEWVTVTLAPPVGVSRPRFSVSFGDGKKQETTKTQIDHKYGKVGHYDVYAWIVPDDSRLPLSVSLSANPKLVEVKRRVKFDAQINRDYPGIKYRFVFGDGDQTAPQVQSYTEHAYNVANTYLAYVDIGEFENGVIKPLSGSARQPIKVNPLNPPPQVSVDLLVEPTTVEVGDWVTFTALTYSKDPKIRYHFVFGDGAQTDWQESSQVKHKYASAKTHYAYVETSTPAGLPRRGPRMGPGIFGINRANPRSAKKPIQVIAPPRVSVDLLVKPTKTDTDTWVKFTALVNSKDPNIRYRFFYGDRSSSKWQDSESTYKYSVAASYFAYVEAGLLNKRQDIKVLDKSKTEQITVSSPTPTPTPTPDSSPTSSPDVSPTASPFASPTASPGSSPESSPNGSPWIFSASPTLSPGSSPPFPPVGPPDPWTFPWWYLLIALLIAGGGYWAFKALFAPKPTFRSRADAGSSEVDAGGKPLAIESQILLKPNIADGQYRVGTDEGDFIQSVRREND